MPNFVVTTVGLTAVAAASPSTGGPYVNITSFRLGSDYATAATVGDTSLVGSTVYSGSIASYSYYDSTTVQINLEIPASAGPFDYGEIGLFLNDGTLFARFSYGILRHKSESSTSGYTNTLRIKALVRLAQGPAIFNFTAGTSQNILEVASFQLLQTPADNPANPVVIVHEPNNFQESVLCYKNSATLWDVAGYSKIATATITGSSSTTNLQSTLFSYLNLPSSNLGKYLIQTTGGYIRTISALAGSNATLASPLVTTGLVGTDVAVYQFDDVRFAELNTQIGLLQGQVSSLTASLASVVAGLNSVVPGTIIAYAYPAAPTGYLVCNGAVLSRTTYAALFAAINTSFGVGDGLTTFGIPDLRGQVIRGWSTTSNASSPLLTVVPDYPRSFGSHQLDSMQNITGVVGLVSGGVASATGAFQANGSAVNHITSGVAGTDLSITFDASRQVRASTETRAENVALTYCIKY